VFDDRGNHNGNAAGDADVLLQLQYGDERARQYEQHHIALEVRAADVRAREVRVAELEQRVAELEEALATAVAEARRRAASVADDEARDGDSPAEDGVSIRPAVIRRAPRGGRLGKQLVKRRIVTKQDVRAALEMQQRTAAPLGQILVARGVVTPEVLLRALAEQHGVAIVGPDERGTPLLPAPLALEHRAVALAAGAQPVAAGATTAVAMVDIDAADAVADALNCAIEPRLTDAETMIRLFADAYAGASGKTAPRRGSVLPHDVRTSSASSLTSGERPLDP